MAEQLISPGTFTREVDLSFLPAAVDEIGAAFIGPTVKGPAMEPVKVNSYGDFVRIFGETDPNLYTPYAVREYLADGSTATVIRTLHDDGYQAKNLLTVALSGSYGTRHIGILHPAQYTLDPSGAYDIATAGNLFEKSTLASNTSGSAILNVSGSYTSYNSNKFNSNANTYSASLLAANANYLSKIFSKSPKSTSAPVYLHSFYESVASASLALDPASVIVLNSASFVSATTYSNASTPWIISQTVNGRNNNLFRFKTISDGDSANYECKIAISNIKPAGSVPGSTYGSFTVTVRAVDQTYLTQMGSPFVASDTDANPNILETFDNVNLDPNSSRYIARVIGDRFKTFSGGKVIYNGNYPNKSKYVYVEMDADVDNGTVSVQLVPFGFAALFNTTPVAVSSVPTASYATNQRINSVFNKRKHFGFDYTVVDNLNYLKALPGTATTGSNVPFLLSNCNQDSSYSYSGSIDLSSSTNIDSRKFIVPFQGGFDGAEPNKLILSAGDIIATNTQGYDLSSATGKDYSVYSQAIDVLSNPDEIDINMLVLPGVLEGTHTAILDYARQMCNDRGDVYFLEDPCRLTDSAQTAVDNFSTIDNSYASTYYPWVKVLDTKINKPVWVPPTVVLPGVIAFNDKVSAPWYAPAGLNRGGLTSVIEAYTRLTQAERDLLYAGRVNPIASFANIGVAVWGQKTLQAKPSALDRVNVRRLLIAVKKYIASVTRYLVFEGNTAVTRNKFINTVNPYLESIQQRQGLTEFRVIMDDTNNTPDLVDRNILYGQIMLKPTKTAEFILIDFNIMPTGAVFNQ